MPTPHRPWLQELIQEAKRNPSPPAPPSVLQFTWEQWAAMPTSLQEFLRCRSLRDRIDHGVDRRTGKPLSMIRLLLDAQSVAEFWQRMEGLAVREVGAASVPSAPRSEPQGEMQ